MKCFSQGIVPDNKHPSYSDINYKPNGLGKQPWIHMKANLPSDSRPTFHGIAVLCSGELENRTMRRWTRRFGDTAELTIDKEVKTTLKEISDTYLKNLIKFINGYFINGQNPSSYNSKLPEWISLSKNSFDFTSPIEVDTRKASFPKVIKTMVQPLTQSEADKAVFEYNILLERVSRLIAEDTEGTGDSSPTLKSLLYRICSTPKLYSGIELAIHVMLYNIVTATSECGIESLISSISENNNRGRPISLTQLHSELMVKQNGPHPLHSTSEKFLKDSLTQHFGGGPAKWTFCKSSSYRCPEKSVVINRLKRNAPEPKL
jgi:hypothetical protein